MNARVFLLSVTLLKRLGAGTWYLFCVRYLDATILYSIIPVLTGLHPGDDGKVTLTAANLGAPVLSA